MNAHSSRRLARAMIAAVGCAVAAPAHAQVVNWNEGDGVRGNAAIWNPAGVPNSSSALVAIGAPGTYTVGIDLAANVGRLRLSNPGGVVSSLDNGRSSTSKARAGSSTTAR